MSTVLQNDRWTSFHLCSFVAGVEPARDGHITFLYAPRRFLSGSVKFKSCADGIMVVTKLYASKDGQLSDQSAMVSPAL